MDSHGTAVCSHFPASVTVPAPGPGPDSVTVTVRGPGLILTVSCQDTDPLINNYVHGKIMSIAGSAVFNKLRNSKGEKCKANVSVTNSKKQTNEVSKLKCE